MLDIAEAASRGDVVMILLPDEKQAQVWREEIADGIAPGNLLLFAHGFAIHFGQIEPPRRRRRRHGRARRARATWSAASTRKATASPA